MSLLGEYNATSSLPFLWNDLMSVFLKACFSWSRVCPQPLSMQYDWPRFSPDAGEGRSGDECLLLAKMPATVFSLRILVDEATEWFRTGDWFKNKHYRKCTKKKHLMGVVPVVVSFLPSVLCTRVGLFTSCSDSPDQSCLSLLWFYSHSAELNSIHQPLHLNVPCSQHTNSDFQCPLHSLVAVVPLHTQRFAAIGRLQQLELKQDGLVQVSAHERLIVEDGDADNWGVHYWMPGQPEGEKEAECLVGRKWSVMFSNVGTSREEPCYHRNG